MQMWGSPYQNTIQCARCVFRSEGVCAFYRSYTTQLMLNIPFQGTHFVVYELVQQTLNPHRKYSPVSHSFAGALAGGVAAAITTPLDVIKTVLNTQQTPSGANNELNCPTTFRGILDAARNVFLHRGIRGFLAGMQARVLFQVPSTAIAWSVYEFFKFLLAKTERIDEGITSIWQWFDNLIWFQDFRIFFVWWSFSCSVVKLKFCCCIWVNEYLILLWIALLFSCLAHVFWQKDHNANCSQIRFYDRFFIVLLCYCITVGRR